MQPRLTRLRADRMIGGVCSGLGQYFGVDPVIVRLIFVVLAVTTFLTPLLYPILWLVMPEEGTPNSLGNPPSVAIPPDARFDPMTGQPLPPLAVGQTVYTQPAAASSSQPTNQHGNGKRTLGFLLIGIGGLVLVNQVGEALGVLLRLDVSNFVFPLLLVGLGVYLLRRKTA